MNAFGRVAAAALIALPGGALACEKATQLAYAADAATLSVTVNGLPVVDESDEFSTSGFAFVEHWLVKGENVMAVEVAPKGENANTKGLAEIVTACRGDMIDSRGGNAGAIAAVTIEGAGSESVTFTVDEPVETSFSHAEAAGDAGLTEAVAALAAAFEAKDMDAIAAAHQPMIEMATLMGMDGAEDMLRGMLGELFETGKLSVADGLEITSSTDGRIFAVEGADGAAPIALEAEQDGGSFSFTTGAFWARLDGDWKVIAN